MAQYLERLIFAASAVSDGSMAGGVSGGVAP
jgi:hypothetical protein